MLTDGREADHEGEDDEELNHGVLHDEEDDGEVAKETAGMTTKAMLLCKTQNQLVVAR